MPKHNTNLHDHYVQTYREWQIYELNNLYVMQPANKYASIYIAVNPVAHQIAGGMTVADTISNIEEYYR